MALRLILYENSPEILDRLKSEGFSICSCVKDANAICYFTTPKWCRDRGVAHIHGFFLEEEPDMRLYEECNTLEEFINKAKPDKLANE